MATLEQLEKALINADKAGDSQAATVFAGEIRKIRGGQPQQPKVDPSVFDNGPLKIGKEGFADTLRNELKNTDWITRNVAGAGSSVVNAYEGLKGLVGKTNNDSVANQKVIAEEAPIGNLAGNVALLAPTAMIPGANTMAVASTIGAVQGALLTPGDIKERGKAAAFGAGGGAIGTGLTRMIGRANPAQVNPNVRLLEQEGVGLTPGQNAGGWLKSFEDKATSMPIVGNIINNSRRRGIDEFNRAAINRATLPGMQVEGVGNGAMQDLRQGLGQAYDDVLSRSHANATDPQYVQQMAQLRQMVSALPEREQRAFDNILQREVGERMAPNGMINAENLQAVNSGVRNQIDNFATSNDGYQRQLAQALRQADANFRELVSRANPQNAQDLQAVNAAYANFKRLQKAASTVGADEGVFTPAQLHNAVRALDRTKDKRAFSEGEALLQDLSSAGKDVMPSKIPDSGTAGRLMNNLFSVGGLANTAGGLAAAIPALVAYSRPGSAAINGVVNNGFIPARNALQRALINNPNAGRVTGTALSKLVSN